MGIAVLVGLLSAPLGAVQSSPPSGEKPPVSIVPPEHRANPTRDKAKEGVGILWGGDERATREIYTDIISVRMKDKSLAKALVNYSTEALAYVGQDGNARFPDNRACFHNDIRRTLFRSLKLQKADGSIIDARTSTIALPSLSGERWRPVATCNDKIDYIRQKIARATGDKATFENEITGEQAEVKKILKEYGEVLGG